MKEKTATSEPPLRNFLKARGIRFARIFSKIRRSRSQFDRWLKGQAEPRRSDMVDVLWAVQQEMRDSSVHMAELFDLDPASAANRMRIESKLLHPRV